MHIRRIVALSLAHFVVAMLIATVAFGLDMDRLRSRSALSRTAAAVHDVLWLPHDSALRALPNAWIVSHRYIIPVALVLNSLAWGLVIYLASIVIRGWRQRLFPGG